MSLTGNLGVFPLEDVLRMLSHSQKTGCLRIEGTGVQGRVYLDEGMLSFATVTSDEDLRRQLIAAGLVDDAQFRRVELSGAVLSEVLTGEATPAALAEFVREHVVESLYRIRRPGAGTFDFQIDKLPRYPTGQRLDVDMMLSEADRRAHEWQDIEAALPDGTAPLRMVPQLPDESSVTLSPLTWRILASLGAGASTMDIARALGMSAFWTSSEMAGLVRNGLVEQAPAASARAAAPAAPTTQDVVPEETADSSPEESTLAPETDLEPVAEDRPWERTEVEAGAGDDWPEPREDIPGGSGPDVAAAQAGDAPVEVPGAPDTMLPADDEWGAAPVPAGEADEDLPVATDDVGVADDVGAVDDVPAVPSADVDENGWVLPAADAVPASAPEAVPDSPWERVTDPPADDPSANPWQSSGWEPTPGSDDAAAGTDAGADAGSPWSRWGVVEGDDAADEAPVEEVDEVVQDEAASEAPEGGSDGGWWPSAVQEAGDDSANAEPDADASTDAEADRFLESVFSSLSDDASDDETNEDETGFGLGLLRRRRMNAAARDLSENDD